MSTCANCLNTVESVVAKVGVAVVLLKPPVHRALADLGLVARPDPVAHDVRTIAFLRSLELDPVEILGAQVVDRAERWQPAAQPARIRSARPIGSQSLLSAQ